LQQLSALPSEIVRRQLRVTPYPHEDAGWIIANSGDEVCAVLVGLPTCGRRPRAAEALRRIAARCTPEADRRRFYADNFIDLMGAGLGAASAPAAHLQAA
jgi:hypothetical protein